MTLLEKLKAAHAASTQGEWLARGIIIEDSKHPSRGVCRVYKWPEMSANAQAITLMHNNGELLLRAVDLLEKAADSLEDLQQDFDVNDNGTLAEAKVLLRKFNKEVA